MRLVFTQLAPSELIALPPPTATKLPPGLNVTPFQTIPVSILVLVVQVTPFRLDALAPGATATKRLSEAVTLFQFILLTMSLFVQVTPSVLVALAPNPTAMNELLYGYHMTLFHILVGSIPDDDQKGSMATLRLKFVLRDPFTVTVFENEAVSPVSVVS